MQDIGIPCRKNGFLVGPDRADRPSVEQEGRPGKILAGLFLIFGIGPGSMEQWFNEHHFE